MRRYTKKSRQEAPFSQVSTAYLCRVLALCLGPLAYRLYYEDGYPLDLIQRYAEKHGMTVDVNGFYRREEEVAENVRFSYLRGTVVYMRRSVV